MVERKLDSGWREGLSWQISLWEGRKAVACLKRNSERAREGGQEGCAVEKSWDGRPDGNQKQEGNRLEGAYGEAWRRLQGILLINPIKGRAWRTCWKGGRRKGQKWRVQSCELNHWMRRRQSHEQRMEMVRKAWAGHHMGRGDVFKSCGWKICRVCVMAGSL